MYLDGTLKLDGIDPLPSEMDHEQDLDVPPPALQICGSKDGRVTELAEYHKWEKTVHLADSFEMLRQRWRAFKGNET